MSLLKISLRAVKIPAATTLYTPIRISRRAMSSYSWQKAPSPPATQAVVGRSSHSLNVVGNKAYIFSGENVPRQPIDADLHVYNLAAKTWLPSHPVTSETPSPRVGHGSATVENRIYVFGGRGGAEMDPLDDAMYVFDTERGEWSKIAAVGDVPEKRSYHSMCASKTDIYLFGGCPSKGRLSTLHRFHIPTSTWHALPTPPSTLAPRGGAGLAYLNGKVYVHAGFCGTELDDTWVFDVETQQWNQIAGGGVKPTPRSVHGFVALERRGVLCCVGGEGAPSALGHAGAGKYLNDVWILTPTSTGATWEEANHASGEAPTPRGWVPAAVWKDDSVVIHGGFDGEKRDDGLYVLKFE
ncbi:hypothetical protein HK104_001259 [Borealophlyctis nickersoniae]|nr:hypothetical protein HK104_001259 [Borealophlyctis nickersoniae]